MTSPSDDVAEVLAILNANEAWVHAWADAVADAEG